MRLKELSFLAACLVAGSVQALDLREALKAAEQVDPNLASALAGRDSGYEYIPMARSKLLPQVTAIGTYQKSDQEKEQVIGARTSISNYKVNATSSQIQLRQALIRPRDWYGLSIAQLQADISLYELTTNYSQLWQKVTGAWLDVLATQEIMGAHQKSLNAIRQAAQQAQKAYAAGSGTKDNMMEAKAQLDLAQANFREAELAYQSKLRILESLTGIKQVDAKRQQLPDYKKVQFPLKSFGAMTDGVMASSPELMAAKATAEARQLQVSQLNSDHAPTLDLIASSSKTNNDNINQIGTKVITNAIGVQLNIPIFSGGYMSAAARQASANYLVADNDRKALEQKLKNQIDSDWAVQQSALDRVIASQALVDASKDQLRGSQLGLKGGIRTWADLGNAHITLARRQQEHISYVLNGLKTQLRLLGLLPISDDAWINWVEQMNRESLASK